MFSISWQVLYSFGGLSLVVGWLSLCFLCFEMSFLLARLCLLMLCSPCVGFTCLVSFLCFGLFSRFVGCLSLSLSVWSILVFESMFIVVCYSLLVIFSLSLFFSVF